LGSLFVAVTLFFPTGLIGIFEKLSARFFGTSSKP
jgi:hypothetical protein